MNSKYSILIILAFLFTGLNAQETSSGPYFLVNEDVDIEQFPLQSTHADVNIIGPIADVTITQTYVNEGNKPIEAIYVFPASTRAAVYDMEMVLDNRVIKAVIKEKQEARIEYEKAKEEGKRASLLEQFRPNVFQMNVANIMPGQKITTRLKYTEFIIPEDQIYQFVYPTVVGPRYNTTAKSNNSFASNPYLKEGSKIPYRSTVDVSMHMPVPIVNVQVATHDMEIKFDDERSARLKLQDESLENGNRDLVIEYLLSGENVATGIKTYDHGDEKFFLCQMEAPQMECDFIIPSREYIFIIDVSGSMRGFPLSVSKKLMRSLLNGMNAEDRFNVMFFAGSSYALSHESIPATKKNIDWAFDQIDNKSGGGGTEMLSAIKKAMAIPKDDKFSRSFVIVTDGYVTVEEEVFELISNSLSDANFFAFGIGSGVNRFIIEGIAHVGRAEPFIVLDQDKAYPMAAKLKKYIESPVMTDIHIQAQGVELYDIVPMSIPDLMSSRPIYFFGKYKNAENATIRVSGNQGNQKFTNKIEFPTADKGNGALRYLWAREKIRYADDFNNLATTTDRVEEITELGLNYNLLTKYTSFLAVDEEIVNADGGPIKVKQPLPLPEGVSNYAVGFEMELEDLIELDSEEKTRIDVDVISKHKEFQAIVELVLESIMNKMDHDEIQKLIGSKLEFVYLEGRLLSSTHFSLKEMKQLITALEEALENFSVAEFEGLKFEIKIKAL